VIFEVLTAMFMKIQVFRDVTWSCKQLPTFWRSMVLPSSGSCSPRKVDYSTWVARPGRWNKNTPVKHW